MSETGKETEYRQRNGLSLQFLRQQPAQKTQQYNWCYSATAQ